MAEFTFDDAKQDGSAGSETSGTFNGNARASGESASSGNSNNGTTGNNSGLEGEAGRSAEYAPYGFTKDGQPRKRKPGGGRKPSGGTSTGTSSAANEGVKEGLALKNDREKVKANIVGLHAMAAVLTKQPILNLKENEAAALTNSLCDVADYHNFNLIGAGGAFGLYASLATTAYMIYMPRIVMIKMKQASDEAINVTPGRAREEATSRAGKMDFSADNMH